MLPIFLFIPDEGQAVDFSEKRIYAENFRIFFVSNVVSQSKLLKFMKVRLISSVFNLFSAKADYYLHLYLTGVCPKNPSISV